MLDQERGTHAERDIKRRHEPEVRPVRALQDQSVAECSANGVRGHKDPLGARGVDRAETFELF